jgi:hypothetical protein
MPVMAFGELEGARHSEKTPMMSVLGSNAIL